jgi:hypothetical protein
MTINDTPQLITEAHVKSARPVNVFRLARWLGLESREYYYKDLLWLVANVCEHEGKSERELMK